MVKRAEEKKSSSRSKWPQRQVPSSKKNVFPVWMIFLIVLGVACLTVSLWLAKNRSPRRPPVPPYEEGTINRFAELVNDVELEIYRSLRQVGVDASQVRFRQVVHRVQQNKQWDFTELEIMISRENSLPGFDKILTRNLRGLSAQIRLERVQESRSNLELLIRVEEILTHRIVLVSVPEHGRKKHGSTKVSRVAIVIDDLGYDGKLARQFLKIEAPLSFSVLPHGPFSKDIARRVHRAGHDLLLHLPMEPKGYPHVNPGAGALLTAMNDEELVQVLQESLDSLPLIRGVNNHMGSKFCEYEQKLRPVMEELKNRGLFFLDSRTTSKTQAYRMAQQFKIRSAERNVFLDNIQDAHAIRGQLKRLVQLARLKGEAIGIAHPHKVTLKVLREDIPKLSKEGVEVVPVSQLVH
jgi:hypothetical protein